MRNFPPEIKIVGAMLVSRNTQLLDITIPSLLKYCDWVLILLDNESDEAVQIVEKYQREHYDKIWVRRSSAPHNIITRGGNIASYHDRWKGLKGTIRDDMFTNLKKITKNKGYDKIDILLWPDSDEIFTDYLPELLETFWKSDKKAITMRPVDVVGSMRAIKRESMSHHVHIMRYSEELVGLPWRFNALYYPLTREDLMVVSHYHVHLAFLNNESAEWRRKNWKTDNAQECRLFQLEKDVCQLSPDEIYNILKI